MICDEDPLRRRPRESTARRKRQERCVWMARKMTEWPSKRGPITKIMPSDGCIGDTVPLAVGKWYDFRGALPGDLVVLAQEGRQQSSVLRMVGEQVTCGVSVTCSRLPRNVAGSCRTTLADVIFDPGLSRQIRIDVRLSLGGRRSMRHSTRCFTASSCPDCAEPQGVADRTLEPPRCRKVCDSRRSTWSS